MKPTVLVILDGFGIGKSDPYNAIEQAPMPHFKQWICEYPHALLQASGTAVGLPPGCMGNSEVGHLTIGSGRIIKQPVTIFHELIASKQFFSNPILNHCLKTIKNTGNSIHIMGLLSDAGVHSHEELLYAFLQAIAHETITNVVIHPFLDGRDVPPRSAYRYLTRLAESLQHLQFGTLGSLHGRFYAMDRDHHWDRIQTSYRVLTEPQSIQYDSWQAVLEYYYAQNISDEFIPPTQLSPMHIIKPGDGIIFFNVREDRARQLTTCFVDPTFNQFSIKKLNVCFFITPIVYDSHLKTNALIKMPPIKNTLKEVLSHAGKTIVAIAETEKYAHITYFFDGRIETAFPHETRILIPSIPDKKYNLHPGMSAHAITHALCHSLTTDPKDFYVVNYANADMVAHSGDFNATVKALTMLDQELKQLFDVIIKQLNGTLYITADHGNAEYMYDAYEQQPHTAHSTNPVPFIVITSQKPHNFDLLLPLHQLADIAPFILHAMGITIPQEMIHDNYLG